MNYQRILEFVSVSFEIFPSKLKKFENSLKLPGVLFLISLIIYKVQETVFEGLKKVHKEQGKDMETNKRLLRKRIDKIDNNIKQAFETGMHRFSQGLQKNIEEWENERKALLIEEQEILKTDKTFFEQSNSLLEFSKDCHNAFLKGTAEQKRRLIKIVCSNFSYDGENIMIEPNPVFKTILKSGISNKKLPRLDSNQQPTG